MRSPRPRPRGLYFAPRSAPRTNALRARATYIALFLSFATYSNIAQAQQLSNRQYARFKHAEILQKQKHSYKLIQSSKVKLPKISQENSKTVVMPKASMSIHKTKDVEDKNDVENKTTKSEKKEK